MITATDIRAHGEHIATTRFPATLENYTFNNSVASIIEWGDNVLTVVENKFYLNGELQVLSSVEDFIELHKKVGLHYEVLALGLTLTQSDHIDIRGNGWYEHIVNLEDGHQTIKYGNNGHYGRARVEADGTFKVTPGYNKSFDETISNVSDETTLIRLFSIMENDLLSA